MDIINWNFIKMLKFSTIKYEKYKIFQLGTPPPSPEEISYQKNAKDSYQEGERKVIEDRGKLNSLTDGD